MRVLLCLFKFNQRFWAWRSWRCNGYCWLWRIGHKGYLWRAGVLEWHSPENIWIQIFVTLKNITFCTKPHDRTKSLWTDSIKDEESHSNPSKNDHKRTIKIRQIAIWILGEGEITINPKNELQSCDSTGTLSLQTMQIRLKVLYISRFKNYQPELWDLQ